jgi:hypothetical protein
MATGESVSVIGRVVLEKVQSIVEGREGRERGGYGRELGGRIIHTVPLCRQVVTSLQILMEIIRFEPTHAIIRGPKFARLVDVNFAGLLSVCLAKFFANAESADSCFKDTTLAA